MIFYHFTTLRCFRKEVQREGYSKRLSGVSFCAVGSFGISVQNETLFNYAKSSAMKNV